MATPYAVECPICFTPLKLKARPKPGARLRCPACHEVFCPEGDQDTGHPPEDESPVERSHSTQRKSKPKGKAARSRAVSWQVPVLVGGAVLLLVGLGVGLFLLRDKLFKEGFGPTVDLAYCQLPSRSFTYELRPAEFLNAPALPADLRQSPHLVEASQALRPMIGAELHELASIELQIALADAVLPPVEGRPNAPRPAAGLMVLTALKPLTRPGAPPQLIEGIRCYPVYEEGTTPQPNDIRADTLFFANPTTAVLGNQAVIRQILQQWKAAAAKPPTRPSAEGATAYLLIDEAPVREGLTQLQRMLSSNPLLAQGNAGAEVQQISQQLLAHSPRVSFSAHMQSQITWTAAVHGQDASATAQLHGLLETIRQKALEQVTGMSAFAAFLPPEAQTQLNLAKQALSTPFQMAGDRVSILINFAPEMQSQALEMLVNAFPPLGKLRVGTAGGVSQTAATTTSPGMSP
uniref:Zinc finger/thioredoxin putative domain-containing protein n=1 Tax=Schlesneria paludicola TaxID=360056 RepID=A0A7C4QN87_9PLAN